MTNNSGLVCEHLEYFAFGETFVQEHVNTDLIPYLFNAKELDEKTGFYYYGARYYDPRTSIWESVDPKADKYPEWSPYNYALDNPVKYIDPDGMAPDLTTGGNGNSDPVDHPTIRATSGSRNKSRFVNNPNFVARVDKATGKVRLHNGLDIYAKEGTPLKSITAGTVYSASTSKGLGNIVIIKSKDENGKTIYVLYAHLSSVGVKGGQKVEAGQQLGATGTSGNAKGLKGSDQHVHIEVSTTDKFTPLSQGVGDRIDPETIIPTKFDNNGEPISPVVNQPANNNKPPEPFQPRMPRFITFPKDQPWRIRFTN